MKKSHSLFYPQYFIWFFLFFAMLSLALMAPIASSAYIPNIADLINHLGELIEAKSALFMGQFPLRVAPQWGYPVFQFYASSSYLIAGLIYGFLTPHNPFIAYQITTWCGLMIGGIYMSRLAQFFLRNRAAALLSGVAYIAAPFNIIEQFRFGDFNEGLAMGLVPAVIFYSVLYYYRPNAIKLFLLTSLLWYLLITTHLVTFIYLSFFLGLLLTIMTLRNIRYVGHLLRVGMGYGFGCLLALWFLGPVALFQKYLVISTTYYSTHFLTTLNPLLANLFSMAALNNQNATAANSVATVQPSLGWPCIIGVSICTYAVFKKIKLSANKRMSYWLPALLFLFYVNFLLVWSPFNFWQWLPPLLRVAQYSWRILSQTMWIGALLFGWSLCYLFKNKLDEKHVILGTFLILLSINPWFLAPNHFAHSIDDFSKSPFMVYNTNSFLLDYSAYPQFVKNIDSMTLDIQKLGDLEKGIQIPWPLFKIASRPVLEIKAQLPASIAKPAINLSALQDKFLLGNFVLPMGYMDWQIPLVPFLQASNSKIVPIHFVANTQNTNWQKLPLQNVSFSGFQFKENIVDLAMLRPSCHLQKNGMFCRLNVSPEAKIMELPVFFFPDMLQITLNGQPVSYESILKDSFLIAAIKPVPGITNEVKVRFVGLRWANVMSAVAWAAWICFFCYFFINLLYTKFILEKERINAYGTQG